VYRRAPSGCRKRSGPASDSICLSQVAKYELAEKPGFRLPPPREVQPAMSSIFRGFAEDACAVHGPTRPPIAADGWGKPIVRVASLVAFVLAAYALWRPSIPAWIFAAAANGVAAYFLWSAL
jgi:hypothetical protein